ncbi:MAG: hypothetical protein LBU85_09590, partial [Treponema sp.]|nr:hypothetical protein [Treponema sp.]
MSEMYACKYFLGAISQSAAQTLSEDSTVAAFIYARFGVAASAIRAVCPRKVFVQPVHDFSAKPL